jgi:pimeloyl-ACP methyl ester carboxylesterase
MTAEPLIDCLVLGDGPCLVLLHGAAGTPRDNFPFLDELATAFRVIAPHLPGDPHPSGMPLEIDNLAVSLRSTLEALGVDQFILVGYSLGSAVAVKLSEECQGRVRALALCAAFVRPRPSLLAATEQWRGLLHGDPGALGLFLLRETLRPATLDAWGHQEWRDRARRIGHACTAAADAHLRMLETVDVSESLAYLPAQLMVITPTQDRLVDPAHARQVLDARPDARHVELKSGHDLGAEQSAAWLAALQQFIGNALGATDRQGIDPRTQSEPGTLVPTSTGSETT